MTFRPQTLAFAREHHGLVTLDAWTAAGQGRSSFHRAVTAGELQPVLPGVAALPGTRLRPWHRVAAVVLRLGPDVMTSHTTGSWLWGSGIAIGDVVEVISTRNDRRTRLPGVVIHQPDDRTSLRPRLRWGLPVTSPLRTLLDVGATDPAAARPTLEALVREGHVTVPAVLAALERRRKRGRPGIRAVERAIDELGGVVTDSELENVMRALFRRAGLEGWVFHAVVEGFEVDFCFPAQRVVVEVDGWLFHPRDARRWDRDLERDSYLASRGWLVARYSWRMLVRSGPRCAERLRRTLLERS